MRKALTALGIIAVLVLAVVGLVEISPIIRTLAAWQAGASDEAETRHRPSPLAPMGTTTMQMHSVDVVLVMALVLQHHGTTDAVRRAAGQLRDRVCAEHRPNMTALRAHAR